jgi:hypothetical protein
MDYIHGPEDDVFDMGTLLYGIFFEERLFHNLMDSQIRRNIAEGKFPDLLSLLYPFGTSSTDAGVCEVTKLVRP